ncbi:MAG: M56 family metallopeptidase [Mycobacteriales bacterium]
MLFAAAVLTLCLLLLAVVVPERLARASWAGRSPGLALLLWQALGLAGGLLAIEVAVTLALSPAGPTHLDAVRALAAGTASGLPVWSYVALAVGALVLLRLLSVLVASTARTLRARRHHRVLVDMVATRNPLLADTRVLEHTVPVAYCLPGLRPRVVLSSGVLALLRDDEVRAVLAHEAAHVEQRHDVVVLPFVALRATFPGLRGVRTAQAEVALLVEMLADDRAVRRHPRDVLARALYKVGAGAVPAGALGVAGAGHGAVLVRAQRLLHPTGPLGLRFRLAILAATAVVLGLAPLGLLLPMLVGR